MPIDHYFFNLSPNEFGWVQSVEQPSRIDAPVFGYGDLRDFGVTFVWKTSQGRAEKVTDGLSARIGLSNASTGAVLEPAATAGTPDNYEFPFELPVSGTNMAALMSGKTDKVLVRCEFKVNSNRYYSHLYIAPQIISDATPDPTATEPATTMSEVAGVFVPKEWPAGMRMTVTDEATGVKYSIGFANGDWERNIIS